MGEYAIPETRVKYKDVFNLKNLYVMLHEFLVEDKWFGPGGPTGANPGAQHSDIEDLYLEKFDQKGLHAGGKEMWVYWRLFKKPEGRYSSYIRYRLNIDWHMVYMEKRNVMHQGKQVSVNWGEMEIIFNAIVETDYRKQWEKHWLLKHWRNIYEKRIVDQEIEKHIKVLYRDLYRVTGMVKKYLDLRVFMPTPEPLYPKLYGVEG